MNAIWYCDLDGQTAGPFSQQELVHLARQGRINPETLVRQQRIGHGVRAGTLEFLFRPHSDAAVASPPLPMVKRGSVLPSQPRLPSSCEPNKNQLQEQSAPSGANGQIPTTALSRPRQPSDESSKTSSSELLLPFTVGIGLLCVALVAFLFGNMANTPSQLSVANSYNTEPKPSPRQAVSTASAQEVVKQPETPQPVEASEEIIAAEAVKTGSANGTLHSSAEPNNTLPVVESMADLVEKVEPSIVWIVAVGDDMDSGMTGSGFVVDKDGWIVTNHHVLEKAKKAVVVFSNGLKLPVKSILIVDESRDLVIFRVAPPRKQLPVLPLALSLPRKGERVATFGAPLGLAFTVSDGLVSAIRKGDEFNRLTGFEHLPSMVWLQTTAPISPGNSGGPLVNLRAEVVGVNTLASRPDSTGQNLNFAVSALEVLELVERAKRKGR
jgi:S1-C subfamily serine protease